MFRYLLFVCWVSLGVFVLVGLADAGPPKPRGGKCPPGYYGIFKCKPCPAGTYAYKSHIVTRLGCKACPSGQQSKAGARTCTRKAPNKNASKGIFLYDRQITNMTKHWLKVYVYRDNDRARLVSCYKRTIPPYGSAKRKQITCSKKRGLQLYVELANKGKSTRCHFKSLPNGKHTSLHLVAGGGPCKAKVVSKKLPHVAQPYTNARRAFTAKTFHDHTKISKAKWNSRMKAFGSKAKKAGVKLVVLVHGTFVGNDPHNLIGFLSRLFPAINVAKMKRNAKKTNDKMLGDLGNYTEAYRAKMQKETSMPAIRFSWSSANYHQARLVGMIKLVNALHKEKQSRRMKKGQRILLLGHSHAGQLFALLTHVLHPGPVTKHLLAMELSAKQRKDFWNKVKALRALKFDMVTFGTPPRYGWSKGSTYRLINIINHRGGSHLGGTWTGIFSTRDGDYVQQWGIAGTDMFPAGEVGKKNRKLSYILGEGNDLGAFNRYSKLKMRIPNHGKTFLVNYRDNKTNMFSTLAGHGVYTRTHTMLFNLELIASAWYH